MRDDEAVVLGEARSDSEEVGVREGVGVPLRVVVEERVEVASAVGDVLARGAEVVDGDAPLVREAEPLGVDDAEDDADTAALDAKSRTKIDMVAAT